jgi:hypothetical protein
MIGRLDSQAFPTQVANPIQPSLTIRGISPLRMVMMGEGSPPGVGDPTFLMEH